MSKVLSGLGEVYHSTSLHQALSILNTGYFNLSTALGTKSDNDLNQKLPWFLSLTRSKVGDFSVVNAVWQSVVFNLDYDAMRTKYRIAPVDYWGSAWNKSEMEERLLSSKPKIPSTKYIREIHVLLNIKRNRIADFDRVGYTARTLLITAKKLRLPIYVYTEPKLFLQQIKSKAVPIADVMEVLKHKQNFSSRVSWGKRITQKNPSLGIDFYLRVFHATRFESLPDNYKKYYYRLSGGFYRDENLIQLEALIHNEKSNEKIIPLVQAITSKGGVGPFLDYISNKFDITNASLETTATVKDILAKAKVKYKLVSDPDVPDASWELDENLNPIVLLNKTWVNLNKLKLSKAKLDKIFFDKFVGVIPHEIDEATVALQLIYGDNSYRKKYPKAERVRLEDTPLNLRYSISIIRSSDDPKGELKKIRANKPKIYERLLNHFGGTAHDIIISDNPALYDKFYGETWDLIGKSSRTSVSAKLEFTSYKGVEKGNSFSEGAYTARYFSATNPDGLSFFISIRTFKEDPESAQVDISGSVNNANKFGMLDIRNDLINFIKKKFKKVKYIFGMRITGARKLSGTNNKMTRIKIR